MIHATAVGRAILETTNGEVAGADLDMRNSLDGNVTVEVILAMGALTTATIRLYAGPAAAPTSPLAVNGVIQEYVMNAAATVQYTVPVAGLRYFRASVEGDAGFAGSFCTINYYYNDYRLTTLQDGSPRVD